MLAQNAKLFLTNKTVKYPWDGQTHQQRKWHAKELEAGGDSDWGIGMRTALGGLTSAWGAGGGGTMSTPMLPS